MKIQTTIICRILLVLSIGIIGSLQALAIDPSLLKGLTWRSIGPFRGGRVSAVAGVIGQPGTFYIGLPQGGVWKTTSAGQTWYPVFDSVKETACVGSVAVAPSDPNVIYAGTGESAGNGDGWGLYKSNDAGKTWTHLGLIETRIIPAILVDPKDPNKVILAAEGNRQTHTDQRGVFRSSDGGKTWDHTLFIDHETGIAHLAWAYDHPEVIIATSQRRYNPGPGQPPTSSKEEPGIYKSIDEGKSWTKLEGKGLPKLFGRFTVAVAQNTNSQRMFVIGMFGLYRSDDGGANWQKMAQDDPRIANGQGNYSSGVFVDTANPEILYTVATCLFRSTDGGKTFAGFKGAPGGDDPHHMWIDPTNSSRILYGGDQGASVSFDAGTTWGTWYNQATAQVYHITTDNQYPYWIYATQQDSGVVGTSSRGNLGAITNLDWTPHAGFEFGFIAVDPLNPKITYALGSSLGLAKFTNPSGQWVDSGPSPQIEGGLRSSVNIPIAFSHSNPKELLAGYQCLMSTLDGGLHWRKMSPDLAEKPEVKGATPQGNRLGVISSFSESTVDSKVIWTGSNNGLIHVTSDRGLTWMDANLPGSSSGNIGCIEASHHDSSSAYVAVNNGPSAPSLYRTRDFGKTWLPIMTGFPKEEPFAGTISVVRADTKRKGLLFAGNQSVVYVSFDDGDHWQSLSLNLPTTQMMDMEIHGDDLILGTYGRGIWILDDISPLRQIQESTASESVHLFKPGIGIRVRRNVNGDTPFPPEVPHAKNPPVGVCIDYVLRAKPKNALILEIIDSNGKVIRHMSSEDPVPFADPAPEIATYWVGKRKPLPTEVGLNRINWNIRYDSPNAFVHDAQDVMTANPGEVPESVEGPLAMPGKYKVRLTVDGTTYSEPFEVKNDPRSPAKSSALQAQHDIQMKTLQCVQIGWDAYGQVMSLKDSLADAVRSTNKEVSAAAKAMDANLSDLAGKVTYARRFGVPNSSTNFVDLNINLLQVLNTLDTGDSAPTDANWSTYANGARQTQILIEKWREINRKALVEFNAVLAKNGLKTLSIAKSLSNPPEPPTKYQIKGKGPGAAGGHALPPDEGGDDDGVLG